MNELTKKDPSLYLRQHLTANTFGEIGNSLRTPLDYQEPVLLEPDFVSSLVEDAVDLRAKILCFVGKTRCGKTRSLTNWMETRQDVNIIYVDLRGAVFPEQTMKVVPNSADEFWINSHDFPDVFIHCDALIIDEMMANIEFVKKALRSNPSRLVILLLQGYEELDALTTFPRMKMSDVVFFDFSSFAHASLGQTHVSVKSGVDANQSHMS